MAHTLMLMLMKKHLAVFTKRMKKEVTTKLKFFYHELERFGSGSLCYHELERLGSGSLYYHELERFDEDPLTEGR